MNNVIYFAVILILLQACSEKSEKGAELGSKNIKAMNDTTPKVTGIGGIFFKTKNRI
jgi:hypothetical protein